MSDDVLTRLPEAFDVDLDRFLSGDGEVDEDDIFGKDFETVFADMLRYDPQGIAWDDSAPALPSLMADGYVFRHVDAGVLLLCSAGEIVGGYLSCDVSVDPSHQGLGLGTELIIERSLKDGMNPVLHLDEAAYSSAGLAAHTAAWERVRTHPEETAERVRRLDPPS